MKKNKFLIPLKLLPIIKNKYFLTLFGAIIWLCFFDRNDVITTWTSYSKLDGLRKEKVYYEEEIKKYKDDLNHLLTNKTNMEKYGREKYLMKKDNEDVYVIVDEGMDK